MTRYQAHPSEEVIARITRARALDRRYTRALRSYVPEPVRDTWRDHLRDAATLIAPFAVLVLIVLAFGVYFAIASAAQVAS